MKVPLQTRVSFFVSLIIIAVSIVGTGIFTSAYEKSEERGLIARGTALGFALAKAAEEGLRQEDLDLIKKAADVIRTPDIALIQIYTDLWDAVDAYPLNHLHEPPLRQAVDHFKLSTASFSAKTNLGYDFYCPIIFKPTEESVPETIGFARVTVSTRAMQEELRDVVVANVAISIVITLGAVLAINLLISRFVVMPVQALYRSMDRLKSGDFPEETSLNGFAAEEIRELTQEFFRLCRAVREKEQMLVESDKRIRSLFDRAEHAIFRLDGSGIVVESNSRFEDMFGNVHSLSDILRGEGDTADSLEGALSSKGFHAEKQAAGREGRELVISLSLYPEYDANGETKGFDGYIIDITEQKQLEERLIRAQEMEAVGTLAGGMAHDFNNLLTAILGYSEIILESVREGDPLFKPATIIHDAAERGAEFGQRVLSITHKSKIETRPTDINAVVRNSIEFLARSLPRNIEIATRLGEGLPAIMGDQSQLQQVIINLAVNARDAMPSGGRLLIETSASSEQEQPVEGHTVAQGFVRLSVEDTGSGIDAVTKRKIFDPFFTTKEMGKGTGLGLYIVHSIVAAHGGYINLYSEPGRGTHFNIYLPSSEDAWRDEAKPAESFSGSGTILVIDDEDDIRELCADILEPMGYRVLLAPSGRVGVEIFRQQHEEISVVILDIIMPKMSGSEVFPVLKSVDMDAKIVICSGYSRNGFEGIERLLKQGAVGFIQKPFTRQGIASVLKTAMSGQ